MQHLSARQNLTLYQEPAKRLLTCMHTHTGMYQQKNAEATIEAESIAEQQALAWYIQVLGLIFIHKTHARTRRSRCSHYMHLGSHWVQGYLSSKEPRGKRIDSFISKDQVTRYWIRWSCWSFKGMLRPPMLAHAFNFSTWKAKTSRS